MARKVKRLTSRTLIVAALLLFPVTAGSQGLKQVYISYGAVDVDQLPGWIAKETGIFRQNGLDAQLVYFTGGAQRIAALLSGDAPITQGSGPAAIISNLRGADVVVIAGGTVTLDFWLMSRPEIKSPQQLRGGSIGISRFGGVNDSILRFLMPKLGLTIGKDVAVSKSAASRSGSQLWRRVKSRQPYLVYRPISWRKKKALTFSPMWRRWASSTSTRRLPPPESSFEKILTRCGGT